MQVSCRIEVITMFGIQAQTLVDDGVRSVQGIRVTVYSFKTVCIDSMYEKYKMRWPRVAKQER